MSYIISIEYTYNGATATHYNTIMKKGGPAKIYWVAAVLAFASVCGVWH